METKEPAKGSQGRGLYGQRPSKSFDDLRRREFARIAAMTARERRIEALGLDREFSPLLSPEKEDSGKGRLPT